MRRTLGEMKRRRVLKTASYYVVAAWILLQVIEVLQDFFPAGTMRWLLVGLAVLYPLVLIVGWFFDISAEGVRLTKPLATGEDPPPPKFIDHVQFVGHIAIIGLVAFLVTAPPRITPQDALRSASSTAPPKVIAVLAFEDLEPGSDDDRIGVAMAEELRQGLTRTAGLRVIGPKTSEFLLAAGEARHELASEIGVSSLLQGVVRNDGGQLTVDARIIALPEGQPIWQASFVGVIGDAIRLQQDIIRSAIGAVAPSLDPDPINGPRAEAGECAEVYDMFLRGKQLSRTPGTDPNKTEKWRRGQELITESTEIDPACALAWEAMAVNEFSYSLGGVAKAGAAARRALELNSTLPEAWSILAEIAEQERRWSDAEEYFLKAIYADPTNLRANLKYSESLITRGRVKDALRHALDVYRRDPASHQANWRVQHAALYAGDWDLVLEHIGLYRELRPTYFKSVWWEKAYALLMTGEHEEAMQLFTEYLTQDAPDWATWYLTCISAREDETLRVGVHEAMATTTEEIKGKDPRLFDLPIPAGWAVITCDSWIGNGDLAIETMLSADITELQFFAFFMPESTVLRQHPRFRALVVESGLLDYWREWGWSDYCEPVGEDDFRCS